MPYLLKVANGTYPILNIYGNTYNTIDGTAERDFIHIEDLARAHVLCINQFKQSVITLNIGTGKPTSVLQLIETFQRVNQKSIPYCFIEKREGDIETSYSLINKASEVLQFQCHKTIDDMCKDAYHFISMN
jgi:UDP-glucose 4-epimerase